MSQLSLYLPDAVASKVRRAAKKRRVSVSNYIASLVERDLAPADEWGDFFEQIKWKGEPLRRAEPEAPLEERDLL